MNPDSIVGFISGTSMCTLTTNSLLKLFQDDNEGCFGGAWLLGLGLYVPHNRYRVAEQFVRTDREWLLFVDSDMVFEPHDVWALYEHATDKPGVYGGVYVGEDGKFCCGPFDEDLPGAYRPLGDIPDRPVRGVVGMGLTLIHRQVLEAIGASLFKPYADSIGEDVAFCSRARDSGFTPWVVPASQPGHYKELVLYADGRQVSSVTGAA